MGRHIPIIIVLLLTTTLSSCRFPDFLSKNEYKTPDWSFDEALDKLYTGSELEKADATRILKTHGKKTCDEMLKAVRHEDPKVREWAVYIIGSIPYVIDDLTPILVEALSDEAMPVRYEAARGLSNHLGRIDFPIDELVDALSDEDWRVIYMASYALSLGPPLDSKYAPALMDAYDSDRWAVKSAILRALIKMSDPPMEVLPQIIPDLAHEDSTVRSRAAQIIGKVGVDEEIAPLIFSILADKIRTNNVRPERLFTSYQSSYFRQFLTMAIMSRDEKIWSDMAFVLTGGKGKEILYKDALVPILLSGDFKTVQYTVEFLAFVGPPASPLLPELKKLLKTAQYTEIFPEIEKAIGVIEGAKGVAP